MTLLTDRLSLAVAGQYQIERHLGEGGMAIVYLAHDLKHDRKVAVKVLRPELAAVLGAERFLLEIKTTASLQHPNILPLFDSGRTHSEPGELGGEFLYYVMPYVEGETLRARLNRETQLGIDEAVRIATEVADALDYAHRHGTIHRDIKPENILLHDGRPLIADFGIALAISAAAGGRMTETGLSLGTPYYMSPEQATAERELSPRSDIYSLGCVLYEMLAGEPPHTGATAQAIVMKIVTDVARPVTDVRRSVPPHVRDAVAKSLEKLPADRFESARAFADALKNPGFTTTLGSLAPASARVDTKRRVPWLTALLGASTVAFAALATSLWSGSARSADAPVARARLPYPIEMSLGNDFGSQIAISPDGSKLVYATSTDGTARLWLLERHQLDAREIAGTEGAHQPFFSPDGSRVAFITWERELKVVSLTGEPPTTIADSGLVRGGGAWGTDGHIYLSAGSRNFGTVSLGLSRIAVTGGPIEEVASLDTTKNEVVHNQPEWLPGGRGVLFVLQRDRQYDAARSEIAVVDLATRKHRSLLQGIMVRYSPTGHLLVVRADGALVAAPFDERTLEVTGPTVPILNGIDVEGLATADIALSSTGTLVYMPGGVSTSSYEAVWVDRTGRSTPIDSGWTGRLRYPTLSPDGKRLAVVVVDAEQQIWIKQLERGPLSRLTFEGGANVRPTWHPDGQSLAYISSGAVYVRRADGTGAATLLMRANRAFAEIELSRDRVWAVARVGSSPAADIVYWKVGVDTVPQPLINSSFDEQQPVISPDGRFIAYVSNESGRYEIFVRPFPDVASAKWQLTSGGGTEPVWSRNGRELFYKSGQNQLIAAQITSGSGFVAGEHRVLFSMNGFPAAGEGHRTYDITADGQRFVMIRSPSTMNHEVTPMVVVDNFFTELRQKMGRR